MIADDRIVRGMAEQLAVREQLIADGARPIGWKVGIGSAAAQQVVGVDQALVGFLTDRSELASGATVSLEGWTVPVLECELAVRVMADVAGDATRDEAAAAVDAVAPAIEMADVTDLTMGPEAILAGNIFHKAVVLGAWDGSRAGIRLDGITLDVVGSAGDVSAAPPLALLGDLGEIVRHTASVLADAGPGLRAGDAIITGMVVPGIPVHPGHQVSVRFAGLESLNLRFA